MKKAILSLLVFCFICFLSADLSFAKPVKKEKVTKAAKTFLVVRYPTSDPNSVRTLTTKGRSAFGVEEVLPLRVNEKLVGYVVDLEPTGFVLFSGDDEMPPVKIYSDTGSYKRLPKGLQRILELELLEDNTTVTSTSKKNQHVLLKIKRFSGQWNYLTSDENQNNNVESYLTGSPGTAILTTTWHQNDPYNFYAPTASGGPGGRAWAGCTATALAQVLRHRRLPALVASNHTYIDNAGACQGTHSINDAGMDAYEWPNMPSSISTSSPEAEKQAVGQLIYHCGVALESNYEASMTSAFPSSVPSVLRTFFNYTCGEYLAKSNYTDTQWYAKIENDIDNNRPAFYAMWEADGSDGHAVVCDGYRNGNEIHLDMGWSGAWTAWYNIDSVAANGYTWTIHGAVFNITPPTNQAPVLSDPRVEPVSGTESTTFEFLVHYYDPDGDPPHVDYRTVHISGGREGRMEYKNGTGSNSNGTYYYRTTLPPGLYSYYFLFADVNMGIADTPWQSGPSVYSDDDAVINIVIQCTRISTELHLRYSLTGSGGPWTNIPITKQILDPLVVPAGSTVYFQADVGSPNYEYREWELYEEGSLIRSGTGNMWWVTLGTGTTELGLNVYYGYTPQNYTISGTVLLNDGTPVPGGVDLTLTSDEQTMSQNTTDGNFSFTGVHGGVSVTITPSASGYVFSPPSLVYNNLKDNRTGQTIVAYPSDKVSPMTAFVTVPPVINETSEVSFSWTGSDDVSSPENLLYQYKLDSVDSDWSAWASVTSKHYDLPNGAYTLWVRAKDEAGNINQAPISYGFVVNAAPKVVSAIRINRSVWASRMTLEMPASPNHPNDIFVLLPEHSDTSDSELVPVTIHRVDEVTPCGASEYVASELGVTESITKANTGYLVSLPDPVAAGQTAQYDIIWGKIKYFGWQEFESIPLNFPNVGQKYPPNYNDWSQVERSYIDDSLRLWRTAIKKIYFGTYHGESNASVLMNISDKNGPVVGETLLRYAPGSGWDGSYGRYTLYNGTQIVPVGSNMALLWRDLQYEYFMSTFTHVQKWRHGAETFDYSGSAIGSHDGTYAEGRSVSIPTRPIGDTLWFVDADNTTAAFWVLNSDCSEIISKTTYETFNHSNYHDLYLERPIAIGSNVFFIWARYWDTDSDYQREELNYQIHNTSGSVVKSRTVLTPVLADSVEKNDSYEISSMLTDNSGKVWISYYHSQSGQPTEFYYVIIGTDGNIWKGPISTTATRTFSYCDKGGYIWATESGQFFVLNDDDTTVVPARSGAWTPTQKVSNIAASVANDGYRLYDRWSQQTVGIDVPSCANPNSIELFDLNLWDNELHITDPNLMKGDTPVWSQSGQFTGHTTVDVSGMLGEGVNILTMTQNDFLGGQVLITFPYTIPVIGDITCDGKVNFEDLLVLADQWLQPPRTPSADLAPSPLDNFVNFLDFAVFAGNWLAGVE